MALVSYIIDFPIGNVTSDAPMRPIPLTALPSFHGLSFEDPDTFLFEFDIIFREYDFIADAQKLKIFPATLKEIALRWFMGLGGRMITSWEGMKEVFFQNIPFSHYIQKLQRVFPMLSEKNYLQNVLVQVTMSRPL